MKFVAAITALVIASSVLTLPASARYFSPEAGWVAKAFGAGP